MQGARLYLLTVFQIFVLCVALWYVFTFPIPWDAQRIAGLALLIIGVLGVATARLQLGKSFAIKAEAHQLVTHGLYSKIRNPIYFFGLIAIIGLVLALHRPVLWVLVLIVVIVQVIRVRREARVLEAAFGDQYREYRRKTWF